MSIYGYINGEVGMLLAPVDGNGRICGYDQNVTDFPHLWIADLTKASADPKNMFDYAVCTK